MQTRAQPPLIRPGSPAYDDARRDLIWNKRLDTARAPAEIASCRSADQVRAAILHAREQGLRVSPRGTGHHYEAAALRDGGLLLDLGGLDGIEIDAEGRTARVGAGVRGGDLGERLAAQGLAFPTGHCADVGLSGYLLAGGFGWNAGAWGAACNHVTAIEMVTAAGERVLAKAEDHADLFWAARGGGAGFFGAITAYHLALQPLPVAFTWRTSFSAASVPVLADWLSAATAAAHQSVEVGSFLLANSESGEPSVMLRLSSFAESEEEARDNVASFASPPPAAEQLGVTTAEVVPFPGLSRLSAMPSGKRCAADYLWSDTPVGEMLLAIHEIPAPGPHSSVDVAGYGGQARVSLPSDAALTRSGSASAGIYALWDDPAEDEVQRAWVRRIDDALAPFRTARYVGEADLTRGPERRAECFAPAALERLGQLRGLHDPEGLFFPYP